MRNFRGRFNSVTDMKVRIMEEFGEQVPQLTKFSLGYFEGRQSTKYWIYTQEDLRIMYDRCGNEVMLWCDGQSGDGPPSAKRQKTDGYASKREEKEQRVDELAKELESTNQDKVDLSEAQYRLWARMIITGVHSNKDVPPQIPIITGITPKRKNKTDEKCDLQETIVSTAAAVVKAVNSGSTLIQSPFIQQTIQDTPTSNASKPGASLLGVSPGKVTEIRGKSFGQLSALKKLYDDRVLTLEEFEEQKAAILSGLKKICD